MEQQLIELNEMQNKMKNMHENNMIELGHEVWRVIDGNSNYEISSYGRVKKIKNNALMKPRFNEATGYAFLSLRTNKTRRTTHIHQLIAKAFIDNPQNKKYVDHIDNDRRNNSIKNLRWCTQSENNQNSKLAKNNTSGVKGVSYNKRDKKWISRITVDGTTITLGYFDNIEDAKNARVKRAKKLFGIFINACEL